MNIDIAGRISYFRNERGFSVNYLANKAGVSQSYLREIEMGHYQNPSIDVIEALCDALGVSLREFFDVNTRLQDMKDTLWDEIAKLNPKQRELLKAFLSSMNSPDQLS